MQYFLTFGGAWVAACATIIIIEKLTPEFVAYVRHILGRDGLRSFDDYLSHHVAVAMLKADEALAMAELRREKLTDEQQQALAERLKEASAEAISQYVTSRAQKSL